MKILQYLLKNYDFDDFTNGELRIIINSIKNNYSKSDYIEFANIIVLIENLDPKITQAIYKSL